jgi:hypothetical protein
LLLLVFSQDIGHPGGRPRASPPRQRLGASLTSLAGFQVSMTGRFWVSTEAYGDERALLAREAIRGALVRGPVDADIRDLGLPLAQLRPQVLSTNVRPGRKFL